MSQRPITRRGGNRTPATEPARFVIEAKGACVPGTLTCACGTEALAIWHPEFGVMCEHCRRCYAWPKPYKGPGRYMMLPAPPSTALMG